MKIRCERDALAEAVGHVQRVLTSRAGSLPAISGLLVEVEGNTANFQATDLELTIRERLAVQTDEPGAAVFPRLFGDVVRALEPGMVTIESDDDEATIRAGRSEFKLRVLSAKDFPHTPWADEGSSVQIDSPAFAEALRQVVPAASKDDARPILTGVLLAPEGPGLRLVATDSYRLAMRDLPSERVLNDHESVLVPAKALGELQRLIGQGTIDLSLSDRDASFQTATTTISTRLIEGQFPSYEKLIPQGEQNQLTVERDSLIEAVRRLRLLTQAREGTPIRFSMRSDELNLEVSAHEIGQAHETVDAKYEGPELLMAFNPDFLLDGLQAISGTHVVIETLDALKPATLKSAELDGFLYLLMPVRVS